MQNINKAEIRGVDLDFSTRLNNGVNYRQLDTGVTATGSRNTIGSDEVPIPVRF